LTKRVENEILQGDKICGREGESAVNYFPFMTTVTGHEGRGVSRKKKKKGETEPTLSGG